MKPKRQKCQAKQASPSDEAIATALRAKKIKDKIEKGRDFQRPRGRPTKYQPRYSSDIIDWMTQGFSIGSFAASIDVSRRTLYEWAEQHPEFSHALSRARGKALLHWEIVARQAAVRNTSQGGSGIITLALRNFGREDWTERRSGRLPVSVPAVDNPKAATAAIAEAIRAYAAGEIDLAEAKGLVELARSYLGADEVNDMAKRLAALESETSK